MGVDVEKKRTFWRENGLGIGRRRKLWVVLYPLLFESDLTATAVGDDGSVRK